MRAQDNLSDQQFETFYHRTDPHLAESIIKSGKLKPHRTEEHVFASDTLQGLARSFGRSVVEIQVKKGTPRTNMTNHAGPAENWYGFSPKDVKVTRAWTDLTPNPFYDKK